LRSARIEARIRLHEFSVHQAKHKRVDKIVLSLAYIKYENNGSIQEDDVETVENTIKYYVLLLPLIIDGHFDQEYAVI
jgi:hypothetical protein